MATLKTLLVLAVLAFAMVSMAAAGMVIVAPCNEVCGRSDPEKDECCRAHGYRGSNGCALDNQMRCY